MSASPRGRKKKFSEYDDLLKSLPKPMRNRPKYISGIGIFRGAKIDTIWVKITLRNGGEYNGKNVAPGNAVEIKLGNLDSWSWQQADDQKRKLQGRADRGEPLFEKPKPSFKEWATRWLANAKTRVRDYATIRGHLENYLIPFFGNKLLSDITTPDVNRWQSQQLQSLTPGTVKRQLSTLKAILNDALAAEHLAKNPCNGATPIKGIAPRQRFLTREEILKLLEEAEKTQDWMADLVLWYLHSGMRKSEALGISWSDVRELPDDRVVVELVHTKDGKGRHVPCTKTMCDVLQRQRERMRPGSEKVFAYPEITIKRKWDKVREAAGLQDIVMHDLRRTHATFAAISGVDLRTLAGRIGHSDLDMLERHYAALVGSAQDEAAEKIELALKLPY